MTDKGYDAVVVGVGGMGSATLYHLARRGLRVLGIDRYDIPNSMGSSHGYTRIIRLAYYEHPSYVPLLRRAYELWRGLEDRSGQRLLFITGSLDIGHQDSRLVQGSLASCQTHHLPHQVLTSAELCRRYPGFHLPEEMVAVYQPDGGFLLPEQCIVAHVEGALEHGAEVHGQEQVLTWEVTGGDVRVHTHRGSYRAQRLVVSAGAWAGKLLPELAHLLSPERQVLGWFQPARPALFRLGAFPVFILSAQEGMYYGFPIYGVPGLKLGLYHHLRQRVDPDRMDREVYREDEEALRACLRRYLPKANGPALTLKTCLFTNSPDEHFILDRHPSLPNVFIAAGFSGHGFKFCSVVGEIMADLAQGIEPPYDLGLFRLDRFQGNAPTSAAG